jgi:hypothetical protein
MNGPWIAALLVIILVLTDLYEARRVLERPPVDIDRYTRATRARRVKAEEVQETYRRLGLSREEKTNAGG